MSTFELPVRIYFEDTDAGGIAYHASFVRWCERGRTDFLRLLGTDARRLIDGSESLEPAAFAGYSIRIYHVKVDDEVGEPQMSSAPVGRSRTSTMHSGD